MGDTVKEVGRTFLVLEKNGYLSIKCRVCGLTSGNENDVKHKYCGNCHKFHEQFENERIIKELNDKKT